MFRPGYFLVQAPTMRGGRRSSSVLPCTRFPHLPSVRTPELRVFPCDVLSYTGKGGERHGIGYIRKQFLRSNTTLRRPMPVLARFQDFGDALAKRFWARYRALRSRP